MIAADGKDPPDTACRIYSAAYLLSSCLARYSSLMCLLCSWWPQFIQNADLGQFDWILFIIVIGGPIVFCCDICIAAFACVSHVAACFIAIFRIINQHRKEMQGKIDSGDFTQIVIKKLLMFQTNATITFCGVVAYVISVSSGAVATGVCGGSHHSFGWLD
ncbi:hypothetical protein BC830DRAFT_1123846 [Chytriomyces sp. MP71]|nr:hypothetical protein BC830DRAFT_1123846 [Chytriomyces sp. MP71]